MKCEYFCWKFRLQFVTFITIDYSLARIVGKGSFPGDVSHKIPEDVTGDWIAGRLLSSLVVKCPIYLAYVDVSNSSKYFSICLHRDLLNTVLHEDARSYSLFALTHKNFKITCLELWREMFIIQDVSHLFQCCIYSEHSEIILFDV